MSDTTKTTSGLALALDQVINGINKSLTDIDDSKAKEFGLAALKAERAATSQQKYILFSIGEAALAILQKGVVEVGDLPSVTRLPNVPSWISGITNIRSEIVSVIDLPTFMGWEVSGSGLDPVKKVIVISSAGVKCAVQINQILGSRYKSDDLESVSPPPASNPKNAEFFKEDFVIDEKVFQVLDYEKLLASDRFTKFTE